MNDNYQINYFHKLMDCYISNIYELIDCVMSYKLLSSYMVIFIPQFKNYIENNKIDILQSSIMNIDDFINFSFTDFNEMDDNQSYNEYMPKIRNNNNETHNSTELFNFLLEIKKKSKKLNNKSKRNIEIKINGIVDILNKINGIFKN